MVDNKNLYTQILIPNFININFDKTNIIILNNNKKTKFKQEIFPCLNLKFDEKNKILICNVKLNFQNFEKSKCLFKTFISTLKVKLNGLIKFYEGELFLKGYDFSLNIIEENYKKTIYFRFGSHRKSYYIIPLYIDIKEFSKFKISILCYDKNLLHNFLLNVQKLYKPTVYKYQGIYLSDKRPKLKKFIK